MKMVSLIVAVPLALLSVGMVVALGAASWGCYPKQCDPNTDPLKCQCPPGVCGEYPAGAGDAGIDAR